MPHKNGAVASKIKLKLKLERDHPLKNKEKLLFKLKLILLAPVLSLFVVIPRHQTTDQLPYYLLFLPAMCLGVFFLF